MRIVLMKVRTARGHLSCTCGIEWTWVQTPMGDLGEVTTPLSFGFHTEKCEILSHDRITEEINQEARKGPDTQGWPSGGQQTWRKKGLK